MYFTAVVMALTMWACQGTKQSADSTKSGDFKSSANVKLDGKPVEVSGVTFTPPSTWKDLGPSGMRNANYTYGPFEGDKDSATMAIFYFGQNQGGDPKSNIERWIGQMQMPDGSDPHAHATTQEAKAGEFLIHWVQVEGTYMSGGMMGGATVPKEHYLMAGAVVEAPQGSIFCKLTGPEKTATKMIEEFKAALMGIKKAG
jgi:hypothetical protein